MHSVYKRCFTGAQQTHVLDHDGDDKWFQEGVAGTW